MNDKRDLMGKAIADGDLKTVKELIKEKPNLLNEMTFFGSWLHRAATNGQLEIAQYLIDEGIDVNKNGGMGDCSAICNAITTGKYEMVKLLVKNNVVFDTSTKERNPLFQAISNRRFEIVKYLIEQGIDLSVRYKINNVEQDAYLYSKYNGTEEITTYIAQKMKEKNISIIEAKEKEKRFFDINHEANLEKSVLKEMFSKAIRKTVLGSFKEHEDELIYAISFNINYDSYEPEERYQCEVYLQTEEAYKQAGDEEDIADAKYIPDEYEYIEDGNDIFVKISDYLFQNCINVEMCNELEDAEECEKQEQKIIEENQKIESVLAETIADLRKDGLFKNKNGKEVYVYPYPREENEDQQEVFIKNAKLMNEGLEIDGFIEYLFEE